MYTFIGKRWDAVKVELKRVLEVLVWFEAQPNNIRVFERCLLQCSHSAEMRTVEEQAIAFKFAYIYLQVRKKKPVR